MFLKKLTLSNFRNYSTLELSFDSQHTILLGDNGAGKSNILEAIYFLSTTKSSRVELDSELIKEDQTSSQVYCLIDNQGFETELEIIIQNLDDNFKKQLKVNGVPRRVVDFIGQLPAVIFYPSDINLVTGSPSLRRWHLDVSLAQINPSYKKALTLYEQVVTSRNRVLKRIKEGEGKLDELVYWTDELIKDGELVVRARQDFFNFISKLTTPLGNFSFSYKQNILSRERLDQYSSREIASANTLIGPHRDDFIIYYQGKALVKFGSRGEQRTGTLAFKLGQLEYMANQLGVRPILLLDDVFSELDAKHRAYVTQVAARQQTIISTVELENISEAFLKSGNLLKVKDGAIEK
jgi:DNA replication and repair protein RecF